MATGMMTTSNFQADAVLHVGVDVPSEIGQNVEGLVVYRCTIPGSRTHMADGREIVFRGGYFGTADAEVIEFLDSIAKSPAAPIKRDTQPDTVLLQLAAAGEGAAVASGQVTQEKPQLMVNPTQATVAATAAALKPVTAAQAAAASSVKS